MRVMFVTGGMTDAHLGNSPILPPHIEDTVRAIAGLQAEHHRRASPVQRLVGRSVQLIGRPRFVAMLTAALLAWVLVNTALGHRAFDPSPYPILVDLGELLGLYITVLILITQRHEDSLTQLREQLTLELAILSEQKTAKIIALLEEMRRDNPLLRDRLDDEAAALAIPADPGAVLDAIVVQQEEEMAEAMQTASDTETGRP